MAGDVITIVMQRSDGTGEPGLELWDTRGRLLARGTPDTEGRSIIWAARLPARGEYTVLARVTTGSSTGSFDLEILRNSDCGGVVRRGQDVAGELGGPGSKCTFTFTPPVQEPGGFSVTSLTPGFQPVLQVFGPDGQSIAGPKQVTGPLPLKRGQTYRIVVTSAGGAGRFALGYDRYLAFVLGCGGVIARNDPVEASVGTSSSSCAYRFWANAGTLVTISMTRTSPDLDPWLDLYGPDNAAQPIFWDDDGGGGRNSLISDFRLPEDGEYSIVPRSWNNASTGSYTLLLESR
jgi:hypothetical protein